jgi:hypothetical protein
MGRKSSLSKTQPKKRMNWSGDEALSTAIIELFVRERDRYIANKAKTTRRWADIIARDPKFKDTETKDKQIKTFITNQERDFRRACQKKDSTGFGDLDDETAKEQLEICRVTSGLLAVELPRTGSSLELVNIVLSRS